jgi:hypothetical protein
MHPFPQRNKQNSIKKTDVSPNFNTLLVYNLNLSQIKYDFVP